jgi:ATP-dependent DNA helicase RecG
MISLLNADETQTRMVLDWALSQAESLVLETKRVSGKMVEKALKTVCAFANTKGGWLLLGVEDASKAKGHERLLGISENPEAVDELLRKIGTHLLPAIKDIDGYRLRVKTFDGTDGVVVAPQRRVYYPAAWITKWINGVSCQLSASCKTSCFLAWPRG